MLILLHSARESSRLKSRGWQSHLAANLLGKTSEVIGLGRLGARNSRPHCGAAIARIGGVLAWEMKL